MQMGTSALDLTKAYPLFESCGSPRTAWVKHPLVPAALIRSSNPSFSRTNVACTQAPSPCLGHRSLTGVRKGLAGKPSLPHEDGSWACKAAASDLPGPSEEPEPQPVPVPPLAEPKTYLGYEALTWVSHVIYILKPHRRFDCQRVSTGRGVERIGRGNVGSRSVGLQAPNHANGNVYSSH